jgi:hypothetical protein
MKAPASALLKEEASVHTYYNMKNVLHTRDFKLRINPQIEGHPFVVKQCNALHSSKPLTI